MPWNPPPLYSSPRSPQALGCFCGVDGSLRSPSTHVVVSRSLLARRRFRVVTIALLALFIGILSRPLLLLLFLLFLLLIRHLRVPRQRLRQRRLQPLKLREDVGPTRRLGCDPFLRNINGRPLLLRLRLRVCVDHEQLRAGRRRRRPDQDGRAPPCRLGECTLRPPKRRHTQRSGQCAAHCCHLVLSMWVRLWERQYTSRMGAEGLSVRTELANEPSLTETPRSSSIRTHSPIACPHTELFTYSLTSCSVPRF